MKNERELNEWHLKQEIDILKQKLQQQIAENQQLRSAQGGEVDEKTKLILRSYLSSISSESDSSDDSSEEEGERM